MPNIHYEVVCITIKILYICHEVSYTDRNLRLFHEDFIEYDLFVLLNINLRLSWLCNGIILWIFIILKYGFECLVHASDLHESDELIFLLCQVILQDIFHDMIVDFVFFSHNLFSIKIISVSSNVTSTFSTFSLKFLKSRYFSEPILTI